jgi:hypothetical protein
LQAMQALVKALKRLLLLEKREVVVREAANRE